MDMNLYCNNFFKKIRNYLSPQVCLVFLVIGWMVGMWMVKYDLLNKSYLTSDIALYSNIFWNTNFYDKFLYSDFIFHWHGYSSYLFEHFSPTLLLFAPLYHLFPSPEFLIFIEVLMGGITGCLIYYYSKIITKNSWVSIIFVAAFLFHPSFIAATIDGVSGFRHDCFIPPLIILLAIFFVRSKNKLFFITLIPLLGLKENLPLIGLLLGGYLIIKKDYKKIGLYIFFISVLYLMFGLVLLPYFSGVHNIVASGMVHSLLTLDFPILANLWEFKKWLILFLLFPGILAPEILFLTLPDLLMFYISTDSPLDNNVFTPLVIFLVAAVVGYQRFSEGKIKFFSSTKIETRKIIIASCLALSVFFYLVGDFYLYKRHLFIENYMVNLVSTTKNQRDYVEKNIPREAVLMTSGDLLVHFSNRLHLLWPAQSVDKAEYFLINTTASHDSIGDNNLSVELGSMYKLGEISEVVSVGNLKLFKNLVTK